MGVCSVCSEVLLGCTNCVDSMTCVTCNGSGGWVVDGSGMSCVCRDGMYKDGVGAAAMCRSCSAAIAGCLRCGSSTVCTQADTGNGWELSGTTTVCKAGKYRYAPDPSEPNLSATCLPCMAGCISCTSSTVCLTCDPTPGYWQLSSGTCICSSGYSPIGSGPTDSCTSCPL